MIINGNEFAVNPAFEEMFAESLKVRPCSYDPTKHLEVYTDVMGAVTGFGLPLACKRLWFATYCREHNLDGQIVPELIDKELRQIDTEEGLDRKIVPRYYTSAKADIYINGSLVGTGYASYCFARTEANISNANQIVTGTAISKALTNAGFGVVDRGDLASPSPAPQAGPDQNAPLPFTCGGDQPAQGGSAPASFCSTPATPAGDEQTGQAQNPQSQQNQMQNLFAQLGGVNDELTRAKTVLYPLKGHYAGQKLGELPTNVLSRLAEKETAKPDIMAAKQAAKLILADRAKTSGKPN